MEGGEGNWFWGQGGGRRWEREGWRLGGGGMEVWLGVRDHGVLGRGGGEERWKGRDKGDDNMGGGRGLGGRRLPGGSGESKGCGAGMVGEWSAVRGPNRAGRAGSNGGFRGRCTLIVATRKSTGWLGFGWVSLMRQSFRLSSFRLDVLELRFLFFGCNSNQERCVLGKMKPAMV